MAKWIKPNITDGGLAKPDHEKPDMGNKSAPGVSNSGAASAGLHKAERESMSGVKADRLYSPKKAVKF